MARFVFILAVLALPACQTSDPADSCTTTCDAPPPAACIDATTLRTYDSAGTCAANGGCSYNYTDAVCESGCDAGSCRGADPCDGVVCNQPPPPSCLNNGTERAYSPSGTCSAGQCSYAEQDIACPQGCSGTTCAGDPCAGVSCTQPPSDYCIDQYTLLSYAETGTCSEGACSYAETQQDCPAPEYATGYCANAACGFACQPGAKPSGTGCALAWTAVTDVAGGDTLEGVWGSGPNDIYVVTDSGAILHSTDGQSWSTETSNTTQVLWAIWGSDPTDIYAVGRGGTILYSPGDGTWTAQSAPTTTDLSCVWGSSANDVYVCAGGQILHSTGDGTWTVDLTTDPGGYFKAIWGSGPDDIYAVPYNSDSSGTVLLCHRDATATWSCTDNGWSSMTGVWGTSSDNVYVVGLDVQHLVGGSWTTESGVPLVLSPAIWGSSASDVYLVGYEGAIYHSTGDGTWVQELSPLPIASSYLTAIWGSSSSDIYAVGIGGTIIHFGS